MVDVVFAEIDVCLRPSPCGARRGRSAPRCPRSWRAACARSSRPVDDRELARVDPARGAVAVGGGLGDELLDGRVEFRGRTSVELRREAGRLGVPRGPQRLMQGLRVGCEPVVLGSSPMPWADTLAPPRKAGASSSLARTTACRPERSSQRGCPIGDKAGVRLWTRTSPLLRAVVGRIRRGHEERRNRATSAQANDLVLGQRLRPFAPPSDMTS
jgi:hypothetical protein